VIIAGRNISEELEAGLLNKEVARTKSVSPFTQWLVSVGGTATSSIATSGHRASGDGKTNGRGAKPREGDFPIRSRPLIRAWTGGTDQEYRNPGIRVFRG
jgi:hypothetical protein